jgi:Icc-related predicted phosphoesterase
MIKVAAAGDIHCGPQDGLRVREQFAQVAQEADMLLLAGDLTNHGTLDEMTCLATELARLRLPIVAVLGNHDVHSGLETDCRRLLEEASVTVLDKESTRLEIRGINVGIAGAKGFGGGFRGACGSTFGEPEMRMFLAPTELYGAFFECALGALESDIRIALMHYAPVSETLGSEPREIFPFLGAYQLGEALDAAGCDLALHGHAHKGSEYGTTSGGVPVRNVAQAVLKRPYALYELAPQQLVRRVSADLSSLANV